MSVLIAIVGAESTGKTTLSVALVQSLRAQTAWRIALVDEHLRAWCDARGRTPRADEQAAIAAEQTRRIAIVAADHDVVVADTTALMTAVYSDLLFDDRSLYATALANHARSALTLLTGLDLPWRPDGLQRDGPHVRAPVDARLRSALDAEAQPYAVVYGSGDIRVERALASVLCMLRKTG